MTKREKGISKVYRKIVTSNEVKAFLIFEKCDEEMKEKLKRKLENNGTEQTRHILNRLQNV